MADYTKKEAKKSQERIEREKADKYYEQQHREEDKQAIKKAVIHQYGEWDDDWLW